MTGVPTERVGWGTDTQREDQVGTEDGRLQPRAGGPGRDPPCRHSMAAFRPRDCERIDLCYVRRPVCARCHGSRRTPTLQAGREKEVHMPREREASSQRVGRPPGTWERPGHRPQLRSRSSTALRPQLTQPRSLAPSKGTPGGRGVKDPFWLPACRAESSQQAETAGSPEDDSHGQGNLRGWEPPDGAWPQSAAGAG